MLLKWREHVFGITKERLQNIPWLSSMASTMSVNM